MLGSGFGVKFKIWVEIRIKDRVRDGIVFRVIGTVNVHEYWGGGLIKYLISGYKIMFPQKKFKTSFCYK